MDDDDFKVVVRPKRRQKYSKSKPLQSQQIGPEERTQDEEANPSSIECILKILRDCSEEIKLTSFYESFKELLLMKLHHGSKCGCGQHQSQLTCSGRMNSKPQSTIDSTDAIPKASPSRPKEENRVDFLKQCPSTNIDLRPLKIQESNENQEVVPPGIENLESSDFPLLSGESDSSRLHPQSVPHNADPQSVAHNADHCKGLTNLVLVIYGIGNFAECLIAQYQLALMLALRNTLKLTDASVLVFDPRLSNVEKSALKELGLSLISHNEEGKRPGTDQHRTLFFMPHCGKALCNNLLWANWTPTQLSNIIIIGNSFASLIERSPERLLKQYYYYIWKIHSITDETILPNSFKHSDVFNDTSIHTFSSMDLSELPEDFWVEHTEPVYNSSDLEIIVNK